MLVAFKERNDKLESIFREQETIKSNRKFGKDSSRTSRNKKITEIQNSVDIFDTSKRESTRETDQKKKNTIFPFHKCQHS